MPPADEELGRFGLEGPDDGWLEHLRRAEAPRAFGRIGPYEILEERGRGGQGVVFRARQPGTKREVALKRLIAGSFASASARRRFEREIEIASELKHPGIVTLYGVELVDGQPLLAMEWIEGLPVTEWANGGARPRPRRAVLECFLAICDALTHAHQHGVLHRDLKPSNILVDANGAPHVLDFGLAKRFGGAELSEEALTLTGGFAGTPSYASPEQVHAGETPADARSDQYSLGVVLYELLARRLPFEGEASVTRLVAAIESVDPQPPSRIVRGIPRDLDTIVLKALAKEPAQRYASVDAFAADLRRFQAGEAILAHPPSALYQLRRFVRRRWLPVSFAALLFVLGVFYAVDRALQARELAAERDHAESILSFFAEDTFAAHDPWQTGQLRTLSDALEAGAPTIDERFSASAPDAARVHQLFGSAWLGLGHLREAEQHVLRSLALEPAGTGAAEARRAERLLLLGEIQLADMRWRDAVKTGQHLLPMECVQGDTQARTLLLIARGSRIGARYAMARQRCGEVLELVTPLHGADSYEVGIARAELAGVLADSGELPEARAEGEHALALFGKAGVRAASAAAALEIELGEIALSEGDPAQARTRVDHAVATQLALYGPDHPERARGLAAQVGIDLERGDAAAARAALAELERLSHKALDEDHPFAAETLARLADLREREGDWAAAEDLRRQVSQRLNRRLTGNNPRVGQARADLARVLIEEWLAGEPKDSDELHQLLESSLRNRRDVLGPEHPDVAESLWLLGRLEARIEHDFEGARESSRRPSACSRSPSRSGASSLRGWTRNSRRCREGGRGGLRPPRDRPGLRRVEGARGRARAEDERVAVENLVDVGGPGWIGRPSCKERCATVASPAARSGARMLPPAASFTYKRLSVPPAQRIPWPKTAPFGTRASPCRSTLVAVGRSPVVVKTRLSSER
ncbi:MAG: serine/threonine protein kinase [Planctomycetes bacterium]|nr:serine/threonine protein kinase [Planctomycetota bacterium]